MADHETVRRLALAMPGAFEQASYGGRPSFRTKQRMFTWIREEPEALVVWVESEGEGQGSRFIVELPTASPGAPSTDPLDP